MALEIISMSEDNYSIPTFKQRGKESQEDAQSGQSDTYAR